MAEIVYIVLGTVVVSVYGILTGLLLMGLDRIFVARMQARVGPPIHQPFLDFFKLLTKENIVPDGALPAVFNWAPVVALASTLAILLYLPVGSWQPLLEGHGDLVLIVYLLIIPALAMVAGGFASNSPYATIGAQREMVTMISYELPLATIVIAFAWKMNQAGLENPFSLMTLSENPIWTLVGPFGFAGCLLLLIALVLVTPAELSRIPFDTPEAETELAGGLLVEYSGRNLALFELAMGVKTVIMSTLIIVLFFPWNLSDWISMPAGVAGVADFLFFLVKLETVLFFATSLIRIGLARFRINHVVSLYWKYLGTMSIAGLLLLMLDAAI